MGIAIVKHMRSKLVNRFQQMRRDRIPIIGGGAGTGISAKGEEAVAGPLMLDSLNYSSAVFYWLNLL